MSLNPSNQYRIQDIVDIQNTPEHKLHGSHCIICHHSFLDQSKEVTTESIYTAQDVYLSVGKTLDREVYKLLKVDEVKCHMNWKDHLLLETSVSGFDPIYRLNVPGIWVWISRSHHTNTRRHREWTALKKSSFAESSNFNIFLVY